MQGIMESQILGVGSQEVGDFGMYKCKSLLMFVCEISNGHYKRGIASIHITGTLKT